MAMDDGAVISMTSLLFLGGVQLMDTLGPGLDNVRTASKDDAKTRAQINIAELVAGGTVLGAGAVLTVLARRWEPMIMAGVVVAGSVAAYELAWHSSNSTVDPVTGREMTGAKR